MFAQIDLQLRRETQESDDMDKSCFVKGAVGVGILLGANRIHGYTEVKGFSATCDREEFGNVRSVTDSLIILFI